MRKYYIGIGLLFVVAMASYGLYFSVSHSQASDQQTQQDVSTLSESIRSYTQKHKLLPEKLDDLDVGNKKVAKRLAAYTYKPIGAVKGELETELRYELCATFKKTSTDRYRSSSSPGSEYELYINAAEHGAGSQCYKLYVPAPHNESNTYPSAR